MLLIAFARGAAAAVPTPTVTGPITSPGVAFLTPPSGLDLTTFGFVEEEFFLSGTATAYTSGALGADGKWAAVPGDTAAYVTRVLVRRPTTAKAFNGTVFVEWLNVSGGLDAAPDWTFAHTMLLREGYAWVGVSAQLVGVSGGSGPLGLNLSLKAVNPARYAPLVHPGDSFSYDMFSQVAQAIRTGGALLGDLRARRLIAIGQSQSAFRLVTYVNAIQPIAGVFDGFLVHSRSGSASALSQSPQAQIDAPTPTFVRTDVGVPVLIFETETDLTILNYFPARQRGGKHVRVWEVAGTSHSDTYQLGVGSNDKGPAAADTTNLPLTSTAFGIINCDRPINAGPQHYVLSAALVRLDGWVRVGRTHGRPAPRLQVTAGTPPTIERDQLGNALGGIRTPQVDVPVAALSGVGQTGQTFCLLFGTTTPFDADTLAKLYPSHGRYVAAVTRSARRAVRAGYLLRIDATAILAAAAAASIGQ